MAPLRRMVSEEEIEAIVAKRVKERAEIISEAVSALAPELSRMSDEIAAANHVKQELKRELEELNTAVRLSQSRLEQHARLGAHGAGEQLLRDFGVATLSLDEKQALPEVLEEHVRTKGNRIELDRRSLGRRDWIHLALTFVATIVGAAVGAITIASAMQRLGG